MVASVSALTSSAQAASYYEADDYYSEGGLSPSEWQGTGAEALGLSGEVDRDQFRDLLDGKVAGEQLGTFRDGQLEHRPGWDVTLSAPKSVSIMAEVAGDRRLIAAHGEAVKVAMTHVEKHMAATRIRDGGTVSREATGNLVIASFQHGTSRAQDPQLHTHNVIMNATRNEDGAWRSLEPRALYQLQKQIGAIYRQELAVKVRELGYDIESRKESILRIEADGRGALSPIASPLEAAKAVAAASAQAERACHSWNADQRSATAQLLTSRNRITAVQGYAGTAKTTTVLATFAREAEARGVSIVALAPTASAAMVLGEALDARSDTVARHLLSPERPDPTRPAAWIVDEASLLSARDTARLFDLADKYDARIILVGDVKQLGSVEAGAAFAQLQGAGMETAKLAEIVRQTNAATKDAVLASIEGDARKALAALDRGGGQIIENADRAQRFAAIAERYAGMGKEARARTLVIEPSREGRDALTADIRAALTQSGALTGPAVTVESLANKGLTRAEARDPMSYDRGDVVRFTRDYADKGVTRGEAYRVEAIDPAKSAIALKSEDGREVDWRLRQWGAGHAQAFAPQPMDLKTGDAIRFTRNDREAGRINGGRGEVIAVDQQTRTATIQTARGTTETLNLDSARDRHIAHAYVDTAFAAQGRTADHVMVHADSGATNLVDQKSFYVGISRAKESATIFTNDRGRLVSAINERAGQIQTAIAQAAMTTPVADKVAGAGLG
ncbi:MAG: MobF family relaxase [Rudaea sp.]|uniref:MobF family relaxase n=1 Tax=Rudaea sp. TaxID=2136325 RepID=UPI0039E3D43A